MRVKRFVGDSMNDALAKMKTEFGKDAVILHTKKVKHGGFFGLFGKPKIEIIGAIDPQASSDKGSTTIHKPEKPLTQASPKQANPETVLNKTTLSKSNIVPQDDGLKVWPESVQGVYEQLITKDVPRPLARNLLKNILTELPNQEWQDLSRIWNHLNTLVASKIATVEPWDFSSGQKIAVLIGPTGVGKTTTIAKLAANFALVAGKNVGLITVDTYRIAAVEQLRTYADILGVPLEVVYSPSGLQQAIDKLADRDLILVDTAGRSHRNKVQMAELRNFLQAISAEKHLVVSATTKERDLQEILQFFGEVPIDRLIVTKLDETTGYGMILQAVVETKAPLAFVTTGQSVPEDIEVAEAQKIAGLILGES